MFLRMTLFPFHSIFRKERTRGFRQTSVRCGEILAWIAGDFCISFVRAKKINIIKNCKQTNKKTHCFEIA